MLASSRQVHRLGHLHRHDHASRDGFADDVRPPPTNSRKPTLTNHSEHGPSKPATPSKPTAKRQNLASTRTHLPGRPLHAGWSPPSSSASAEAETRASPLRAATSAASEVRGHAAASGTARADDVSRTSTTELSGLSRYACADCIHRGEGRDWKCARGNEDHNARSGCPLNDHCIHV